jgi:hypothetical protein
VRFARISLSPLSPAPDTSACPALVGESACEPAAAQQIRAGTASTRQIPRKTLAERLLEEPGLSLRRITEVSFR